MAHIWDFFSQFPGNWGMDEFIPFGSLIYQKCTVIFLACHKLTAVPYKGTRTWRGEVAFSHPSHPRSEMDGFSWMCFFCNFCRDGSPPWIPANQANSSLNPETYTESYMKRIRRISEDADFFAILWKEAYVLGSFVAVRLREYQET